MEDSPQETEVEQGSLVDQDVDGPADSSPSPELSLESTHKPEVVMMPLRPASQGSTRRPRPKRRIGRSSTPAPGASSLLAQLTTDGDVLTQKIELERKELELLKAEVLSAAAAVETQRQKVQDRKLAMRKATVPPVPKQLELFAKKKAALIAKYDGAVAMNKELKAQINKLRRERVTYATVKRNLRKELAVRQREVMHVVENSAHANTVLDKTQAALRKLEIATMKEQAEFSARWEHLGKIIADQKAGKVTSDSLQSAGSFTDSSGDIDKAGFGDDGPSMLRLQTMPSDPSIMFTQKRVASYQACFHRIAELTGISNMDDLVARFIADEEQNFSLFRYATQLNTEIERLNRAIAEVDSETSKYKHLGIDPDDRRKKQLDEMSQQLNRITQRNADHEAQLAQAQKSMQQVIAAVQDMFNTLDCAALDTVGVIGDSGITAVNLMPHLGLIEQRMNTILQQHRALRLSRGSVDATAAGQLPIDSGPDIPTGTLQLQVPPPKLEDFEDDVTTERPLSRMELASMLKQSSFRAR